jgi:hypothetical protein
MRKLFRTVAASILSGTLMAAEAASAQTYPPQPYSQQPSQPQQQPYPQQPPYPQQQQPYSQQPPQGYPQPPPPGYAQQQGGYQDPALQPPPGYSQQDAQRDATPQQRDYDRAYAAAAEQWSTANCIRQEQNRTAAGAIIGGVLGAVIGSNLAGGRDRGAGAVIGGALGATAGGAIANNEGPGCPPGFVVRTGAPVFYYGPPPGAVVVYDSPDWYNPWLWYDGRWVYRPYPYHRYWGEHYPRGRRR